MNMSENQVLPTKKFLDILNKIRQEQPHFSSAQRQVGNYVLENYHLIPFLSISSLAENIGVSSNSIIKFCNQLGFSKFTEFKRVFADHAHEELTATGISTESFSGKEGRYFSQGLEDDTAAIHATLSNPVNMENLPKALEMITNASHIYVSGGMRSAGLATFFAGGLRLLGLKAHELTNGGLPFSQQLRMATPEDLVISICLPRYTPESAEQLRKLQKRGVPVMVITDTGLSPVLPYADLAFCCNIPSSYYLPSCAGVLSMIDVICRGVSHQLDSKKFRKHILIED